MPKQTNFNELLHDYLIAGDLLDELKSSPTSIAYKDTAKIYAKLDVEIGKYIDTIVKNVEGTLPEDEDGW